MLKQMGIKSNNKISIKLLLLWRW